MKSAEYTYEMFIAGVSMTYILDTIYRGTVQCVYPRSPDPEMDKPNVTAVFKEVVRNGSIVCPDGYLVSDPKNDDNRQVALREIFRSGWLHIELGASMEGELYTFASPLHRRCIDWMVKSLTVRID